MGTAAGKGPAANSASTANSKAPRVADARPTDAPPKNTPAPEGRTTTHRASPTPVALADTHPAEPRAKVSPSSDSKTPAPHSAAVATNAVADAHPADAPARSVHPAPTATPAAHPPKVAASAATSDKLAASHASVLHISSTPTPTPAPRASPPPSHGDVLVLASKKQSNDLRIVDTHPTEAPIPRQPPPSTPPPTRIELVNGRYPWKTNIVTTVFWIGEPVGGNNFTPNCSSSWDVNWTQSYGGYDNPKPESRRNFLPVNFTPRQNPFYVALPYNDVTRGTTKPEARVVIPWFREAFHKEGESVCRNRWIAIRSHGGRVAYAQWSDCGPFRTDHWQYVFGLERPKPNLNGGAGLDVSPAVRDFLGLQSTDVTDWKFVDAREVPSGPWLLYGDNNPFAQRRYRFTKAGASPDGSGVDMAANRSHSF